MSDRKRSAADTGDRRGKRQKGSSGGDEATGAAAAHDSRFLHPNALMHHDDRLVAVPADVAASCVHDPAQVTSHTSAEGQASASTSASPSISAPEPMA